MRHLGLSAALSCALFSVAVSAQEPAAQKPAAQKPASGEVSVATVVPFAEGAVIAGAVRRECQLGEKLSSFIKEAGQENGVVVSQAAQPKSTDAGRVLIVQINDSMAAGNAFIGHQTYTTVKGTLYQDGTQVANFVGRRNSMGGAFGGFKGNCSVLGRTVEALGEDIGGWLAHPDKDGQLGDLE